MSDQNAGRKAFNEGAFYPSYQNTFKIVRADTDELREIAFRLRYGVYCQENGFETGDGNGLEFDSYDEHATSYLLFHKESGAAVGAGRLIMPNPDAIGKSFPIQEVTSHSIVHHRDLAAQICQISRLCMSPHFRRRDKDGSLLPAYYPPGVASAGSKGQLIYVRRKIPYAPLGLFAAMFEQALENNIMGVAAMFESSQLAGFKEMGISYKTLGPSTDYHGYQQPVLFNIKTVFDNMLIEQSDCWDVMTDNGRLHRMANELYECLWEDGFLKKDDGTF